MDEEPFVYPMDEQPDEEVEMWKGVFWGALCSTPFWLLIWWCLR